MRKHFVCQKKEFALKRPRSGSCRHPPDRYGYWRDKRPDCIQVVIALIVTQKGFPLACEVFLGTAGMRAHAHAGIRQLPDGDGRVSRNAYCLPRADTTMAEVLRTHLNRFHDAHAIRAGPRIRRRLCNSCGRRRENRMSWPV